MLGCRLAHPGGALATNKAAALAKFLKRKLNEPGGAATLDPDLVERAVENAKATAIAGTCWFIGRSLLPRLVSILDFLGILPASNISNCLPELLYFASIALDAGCCGQTCSGCMFFSFPYLRLKYCANCLRNTFEESVAIVPMHRACHRLCHSSPRRFRTVVSSCGSVSCRSAARRIF
jgi:hypothetical protein